MIQIDNLQLSFGNQTLFESFSLHLQSGEKTVLTGESGGGKTTLLNLIAGFVLPSGGTISVGPTRLTPQTLPLVRQTIAYLPQNVHLDLPFGRDLIMYPFSFRHNRALQPKPSDISELLESLLLDPQVLDQSLSTLSGGQKQRLLFGALLLLKRPVLLLDEPTAALDDLSVKAVCDLIAQQSQTTLLSVSHDQRWIESMDRIIPLAHTQGRRTSNANEFAANPLR